MVKTEAAEGKIFLLLLPKLPQAPKTVDPTFPMMQRNNTFHQTLPAS